MITPEESAAAFDAAREQIAKIKARMRDLPENDQSAIEDCVRVLREFLSQSGDHGVLGLSLVYWELVAASTTMARLRNAQDGDPSNG